MEKPDFQNLEEKMAMTRINTQSCTTNHITFMVEIQQ